MNCLEQGIAPVKLFKVQFGRGWKRNGGAALKCARSRAHWQAGAGEMALSGNKLTHVCGLLLALLGFCLFLTAAQMEKIDLEAPELACSEVISARNRSSLHT